MAVCLSGIGRHPSANLCPKLFEKIGAAASCVFGNVMTGIITVMLLYIGSGAPTDAMFGLFVAVLYLGFPFTIISQLTTSPMLDVISPPEKRGYVQGVNSTVMNATIAVAPWLLGMLADAAGTFAAIWTGIAISFLAGAVNAPLIFRKGFGPTPKKSHHQAVRYQVKTRTSSTVYSTMTTQYHHKKSMKLTKHVV